MAKREAVKYRLAAFSKQESLIGPPVNIYAQACQGLIRVYLTIALHFRSWVAARCERSALRFSCQFPYESKSIWR